MDKKIKNKIEELNTEIKRLESVRESWKKDYFEVREKLEKKEAIIRVLERMEGRVFDSRERVLFLQIDNLKDIIRWLIEPSTTKRTKPEDFPHPHFAGSRR